MTDQNPESVERITCACGLELDSNRLKDACCPRCGRHFPFNPVPQPSRYSSNDLPQHDGWNIWIILFFFGLLLFLIVLAIFLFCIVTDWKPGPPALIKI